MNDLAWVAPFKEAVLLVFFTMFAATIWKTYFGWDREQVNACARIPLEDE